MQVKECWDLDRLSQRAKRRFIKDRHLQIYSHIFGFTDLHPGKPNHTKALIRRQANEDISQQVVVLTPDQKDEMLLKAGRQGRKGPTIGT